MLDLIIAEMMELMRTKIFEFFNEFIDINESVLLVNFCIYRTWRLHNGVASGHACHAQHDLKFFQSQNFQNSNWNFILSQISHQIYGNRVFQPA